MTGRDLVSASLRLIGAIAPGESPSATEATDGLSTINRMIQGWSTRLGMIHAHVREEFTLTPSDGSYSLGSSGDFNTSRPQFIEAATIESQSSSPTQEYKLQIIRSAEEWAEITAKDTTGEIPAYIYFEGSYATDTVKLYPVPTTAHKLVLYSLKPLTEIATLDTSVSLPPGYERALVFNGALELAPEYGKSPSELIMMTAIESLADIQRINHRSSYLKCDNALVGNVQFDIYTGDFR